MKKLVQSSFLCLLLSIVAVNVNSQSFSVSLNLPASSLVHSRTRLNENGSVVSVIYDNNTTSSHIVMLNSDGTQQWAKMYQGIRIDEVVQLPSGNLAFAGTRDYYYSVWGVLDQNGNQLWANELYSNQANYDLASLDVLASGKLLYNFSKYSHSITVRCDEGGNTDDCDDGDDPMGGGKNPCFDSFGCDDSGYVSCDKSDDRMMIIRHNANGDVVWAKNYMKANSDYFHMKKIKELSDGSLMAVGLVSDSYSGPNNNGIVVKMDASGEILWAKKYMLPPNPGYFSSTFRNFDIEEDQIFVSGYYTTDYTNMNNFLIHLDANGDVVTSKQIVATNNMLDWSLTPGMSSVTFEQDIKDHFLTYNNYISLEGIRSVEINKVNFDGVLGCEVTDFPVTVLPYMAFTGTQVAPYTQFSILETSPTSIVPVSLIISTSTVTATNSCTSVAGIDEENALHVSVYPNPAIENLNISGLNADAEYMIQMIDLAGKVVQVNKGINGVEMVSIPVIGLSNGSYLVNIMDLSTNSSVQMKWMKM